MDQNLFNICQKIIIRLIEEKSPTLSDLNKIKREISKQHLSRPPKNSEILSVYHELVQEKAIEPKDKVAQILMTRRVRSLSGVTVVSVLTKPYPCPGKCLYCPDQEGVPKSYLRNEPAVMRAIDNKYDPYAQVKSRLNSLAAIGHPTDKIELIVIGGTWSYLPKKYQKRFIHRCFDAANGRRTFTLAGAHRLNAKAKHRLIGITLETRPDYINQEEVKRMRRLGATKVEMGAQCLDDEILSINLRGHGIKAISDATKLLKDAGFKVGYHLMLNLPGATIEQEQSASLKLFQDQRFKPDFLKIYPTAILPEAPLYEWWKDGRYHPYGYRELIDLIKFVKKGTPYYCRIQRVIRDIPSNSVVTGPVKITNLREIILRELSAENSPCHCIRCREVRDRQQSFQPILFREDYWASDGKEIFLSFEDESRKNLLALLRLRIPSNIFSQAKHYWPILDESALIREIHTYGQHLLLGQKTKNSPQHQGLGQALLAEAERIVSQEFKGIKQIAIIAGVGTQEYYRRWGYQLKETYMVKSLLSRPKDAELPLDHPKESSAH
jgi:elongator complex protein 3